MVTVLRLEQVSYQYTTKHHRVDALKNITASFEEGEFYAVIGPSGSGKSTLLSIIAGLDVPTSGSVLYRGKDIAALDKDWYRSTCISLIFQSYNLLPLLTVVENVLYPLELARVDHKEAYKQAVSHLDTVGIDRSYYNRFPSTLSGGEQQRVAIARALVNRSSVLLADEPTGNLDEENTHNIIEMLIRLAHEHNYCVVIVTHDLAVARRADKVLSLKGGALIGANS